MSPQRNPYEVLGLRPGASRDAVRARYRELAARYHPDRHADNPLAELAEEKLRDINAAYQTLVATEPRPPAQGVANAARSGEGPNAIELGRRLKRLLVVVVCGWVLVRFAPLIGNVSFALVRIVVRLGTALATAAREAPILACVALILALAVVVAVKHKRTAH
jgi:hypothetical protein